MFARRQAISKVYGRYVHFDAVTIAINKTVVWRQRQCWSESRHVHI